MKPPHPPTCWEGNDLLKGYCCKYSFYPKNTFTRTYSLMSDQTFGSCGLADLTHEMNCSNNILGFFINLVGYPGGAVVKASTCNAGDPGLILGSRR